jgi:hypothetical protein
VTNGKNIDNHKLQYFPNSFKKRIIDWFARYETTHPMTTWGEVQCAFINRFSEICGEGQTAASLRYAKQNKYEFVKD